VVEPNAAIGIVLLAVGILLIAFEFVHPGVFLLIPGTVVLVGGLMYLFAYTLLTASVYGPLIVTAVAIASIFVTLPLYQRLGKIHRPLSTIPDSLTGEVGVVVAPVVPDSMRGKVRLRSEIWSARSKTAIPEGTRVRVQGGEGVSVWVEPVEPERSSS
jgi:inner membrane protein